MDDTLSEDDALIRDANMDLNDFNAIGVELLNLENTSINEPVIGMEFDSDEAAKEYYIAYAARVGFGVRMNKSRRSRKDDTVIMRRFVCTREGFHSKRVIYDDGKKKRKRGTSREGCMAMIEVIRKDHGKWTVTKLVTEHTHMVALADQFQKPQTDRPIFHHGESSEGFGTLKIYNRGIRSNPFGEGGEAQSLLEYLKKMQAENPAFFYAIQVDNNNCMTNVFWADARARTAYQSFGDSVIFDTTYKKTKYMMPFATFRGVTNHLQSVTFGCALLMDGTKGSYIWLFETWMSAMGARHPISLITDRDKYMEGAIQKVFPTTRHLFCKWHISSRSKQKLADVYYKHNTLKMELKKCICFSETIEDFESQWENMLEKYNLWDNNWLRLLYDIRLRWATVYHKDILFPELLVSHRLESLNKFFKRNFNAKTSLLAFIERFDQATTSQYEKEACADYHSTMYTKPLLKTPSPIEKQAATLYTNAVFEKFQEEFVESLGYCVDKLEDGLVSKYNVIRDEDNGKSYTVIYDECSKKANCSCCKFEYSGILCRHILRVFFTVGIRSLLEAYILRRWTKSTKSVALTETAVADSAVSSEENNLVVLYNDLCNDAVRFGMDGCISTKVYNVAKVAIQKALAEVVTAKNMQRKEQPSFQRCARLQKMQQHKVPLPKLQPKKISVRVNDDAEM